MARISTYAIDATPEYGDKVIGTNSTGDVTKNFTFGGIAGWINSDSAIGIVGQSNYMFQADERAGREVGTISFPAFEGAGTEFSAITTLVFSDSTRAGSTMTTYLLTLVGKYVILADLASLNSFGIYKLTAFTPRTGETGFYDASLTLIEANNSILAEHIYGYATYDITESSDGPFESIGLISEDGSVFEVVVSNAGALVVIPEGSTDPVITSPPVITGVAKVWYTLGAIAGGVTGSPTPITTWQWQRSAIGNVWIDIPGADAATYTLVSTDANQFIRVQQTATNVLDSVTASSTATASIEESIFNNTQWQAIAPVTWGQLTVQTWN